MPLVPKENLIFIDDPVVKDFIQYCMQQYSADIEDIRIFLNKEHADWQMLVKESPTGMAWVPWKIG
jgi:hypothetical protein